MRNKNRELFRKIRLLINMIKVMGRRHFITKYAYFLWVFPFEAVEFLVDLLLWVFFIQALGGGYTFEEKYHINPIIYLITGIVVARFLNYNIANLYFILKNLYYSRYSSGLQRLSVADYLYLYDVHIAYWVSSQVIWDYIRISTISLVYIIAGIILVQTKLVLHAVNIAYALAAFCLGILATLGLGLISASIYLITGVHRGTEPVQWVIKILAKIASGVYFPVEVLPEGIQILSKIIPHTYTLNVIRKALLTNSSPIFLLNDLLILLTQTALLLPLGYFLFKKGLSIQIRKGYL